MENNMCTKIVEKPPRHLDGYRLIYKPEHPHAFTAKSYRGYVYEHLVVAEKFMKRELTAEELVHHMDGNPGNNRPENLIVMLRSMHSKLHVWLSRGAPGIERFGVRRVEALDPKVKQRKYFSCVICEKPLNGNQKKFCSKDCRGLANRKTKRPSRETLKKDMETKSWKAIGRRYGVSDNAVRKWAKQYRLISV